MEFNSEFKGLILFFKTIQLCISCWGKNFDNYQDARYVCKKITYGCLISKLYHVYSNAPRSKSQLHVCDAWQEWVNRRGESR